MALILVLIFVGIVDSHIILILLTITLCPLTRHLHMVHLDIYLRWERGTLMRRVYQFYLHLLFALSLFFASLYLIMSEVHAVENDYIYEPYYVNPDWEGTYEIFDLPSTLIESGPSDISSEVQESMNVSSMTYTFFSQTSSTVASGNFKFGSGYFYNHVYRASFNIHNDGQRLFSSPGTLNLFIGAWGSSATVEVTYSSGVTESMALTCSTTDYAMNYIVIPNHEGNLTDITLRGICYPDVGYGTGLGITFVKYGYILDKSADDTAENTKNIFELLKDFIGGFWNNITSAFQNAISNVINALFVPDEDLLKSRILALKEQVNNSLGILIYPTTFLIDLFNAVKDADASMGVITFPQIKWEEYTIIEETTFDLNGFLTGSFSPLVSACKFATSVVLIFAFLRFLEDTYRRIFDDN